MSGPVATEATFRGPLAPGYWDVGNLAVNKTLVAGPWPVTMLLATRLHTTDWLLERNGPRSWLRSVDSANSSSC